MLQDRVLALRDWLGQRQKWLVRMVLAASYPIRAPFVP